MNKNVKFILLLLFVFTFYSTNVFAKEVDIKITDVNIVDKSNTVIADNPIISDDNVNLSATFKEKDDYIVYEVSIKNIDDKKWKIESISDNNSNKNLDIKYDYSTSYIDKNSFTKIKLRLTYKDKLINTESIDISDILVSINLLSENGESGSIIINNPITHDGIGNYLILLSLGLFGFVLIKTKKRLRRLKIGNLIVIIAVIMSPFMIFADEKYQLDFKISSIKLESEMLSYNVSFNSNGGSEINSKKVTYGEAVGELLTPIKSGYEFDGWYKDKDLKVSVNSDTIITDNITFYAKWIKVPLSTLFSQEGECIFNGKDGVITGENCAYAGEEYIATGVNLNSSENLPKDYDVYFEINEFDKDAQDESSHITFFSTKYETLNDELVPGIAIRTSGKSIEIVEYVDNVSKSVSMSADKVKSIRLVRKAGITYYSFNGNPLTELSDLSGREDNINIDASFGAAVTRDGDVFRHLKATLSNMYIKVGEFADDDFYKITFNPNGGNVNSATKLLKENEKIGTLPSAVLQNYYLDGWYTTIDAGEKITSEIIPNGNIIYFAHWKKSLEAAVLESTKLIFNVGSTKKINILNESEIEEEIEFTSSNTNVATVDKFGNVKGVSEGETIVTIKGLKSGKTITISIKINVNKSVIHFDTNGGFELDAKEVITNSEVGELPVPIKVGYKFDGWYEESDYVNKVTSSTIISDDVIYYAKWIRKEFTTVFSQEGACIFNGKNGVIEGDSCSDYAGEKYIDTGISLYNNENYNKDFDISFVIDEYDPNNQDSGSNQVFMNSKLENSSIGYPGIVFRKSSDNKLEISQTIQKVKATKSINYTEVNKVRIARHDGIIYYSINDSGFVLLQDMSTLVQYFDTTVWFGAAPDSKGNAFRYIKATISNIKIKLAE